MLSVIPHVQIEAIDAAHTDWNEVAARARADPEVLAYAMAKSGRSIPGAPADVPMPYAMP